MRQFVKKVSKFSTRILIAIFALTIFWGCATVPATKLVNSDGTADVLKELMGRKNKIVHLPSGTVQNKPSLLLLHGATEDPGEMINIVREWKDTYDIFLYSYNYHMRAEKVGAALVDEMKRLKSRNAINTNLTVVTFSYSAIIFRAAVILEDDKTVFAGASLIQLVPTAGGSFLARGMGIAAGLVALASKPSAASYPFGNFAKQLWEGEGNRKFFQVIRPERMHSILVEGDSHSLARIRDKEAQKRYQNGIGQNVMMIPELTGVTHDYFPTHPVALAYLREILQRTNNLVSIGTVEAKREHGHRDRVLSRLP